MAVVSKNKSTQKLSLFSTNRAAQKLPCYHLPCVHIQAIFFSNYKLMIIIFIEFIGVWVDGMDIGASMWVALVTSRAFFKILGILGFENLSKYTCTRVGVLAGGSGYIHLGQKESQLVGDFIDWVVRSLLKSQGQEQQTSMTVRYLDGFVWELFSLCSHLNLNIS